MRVGERRNQRGAALETGQSILLDRQRMEFGAEAMSLGSPIGLGFELGGEVRLPEGNVTDAADAEDRDQPTAGLFEVADLLGVRRQFVFPGEMPLLGRDSERAERTVKGLFHGELKRTRMRRRQGIPLGVGPLVHVEPVNVIAGDVPFLQEVNRPAIHAHGSDGQDQRERPTSSPGQLDLASDFVAHVGVEVGVVAAGDGFEFGVPPGFPFDQVAAGNAADAVDVGEVPARRQKALHHRAAEGGDEIHGCTPGGGTGSLNTAQRGRGQRVRVTLLPRKRPLRHELTANTPFRTRLEVFVVHISRAAASLAVFALFAFSAPAQDKVKLEWKFEKGKAFYQEMKTTTNQNMKVMGQEVTQKQDQTFFFSYTPVDVDKDGNWTIKQKIEGVKITIDINNAPISYDSTNSTQANNALADFFKQLVGAEFTLTLDKNMKVTKIEGQDAFIKNLVQANSQMEGLLKKILNNDTLKEMANPTFGIIPGKEVAKGETWKKSSSLNLGPIGSYDNEYTFTCEGKEKDHPDIALIKVETKLTYKSPTESEGSALPFKIKSANLASKNAGGQIKFDLKKNRLAESNLKLQLEGSLDIEIAGTTTKVDLKQEQTTVIKNSDTNPIPPKK